MYDVTDFIFIENWSGFKSFFEDLVDMCYTHRTPHRQRVVLKVYPADTNLGKKYFPLGSLKMIMGAAMTGGGSLMIAGEPDEQAGKMHALNSLYYPDNVAIPDKNFMAIENYNRVDALLYRVTHGRNVRNIKTGFELPGCITRAFSADNKYLVVQILQTRKNWEWSQPVTVSDALVNYEIALALPGGRRPAAVYYATPDYQELICPQKLDWEWKDGHVRTLIPRLQVHGTLVVEWE